MNKKIAVLICAYNEEKNIRKLVNKSLKYINEVVVVNDGSSDKTLKELKKTKAKIIDSKENLGKGASLKKGFEYGWKNKYDYFILLDGDGQHDPSEIPLFVEKINQGYDIIIGTRTKRHSDMPYLRRFTNFITSLFLSIRGRVWIKDTQSGYRAINLNFLKNITLVREKYDLESEILIKMIKKGAKYGKVPIKVIYGNETSSINPIKDTYRFFRSLFMKSS